MKEYCSLRNGQRPYVMGVRPYYLGVDNRIRVQIKMDVALKIMGVRPKEMNLLPPANANSFQLQEAGRRPKRALARKRSPALTRGHVTEV